jgi:hypothetical protein
MPLIHFYAWINDNDDIDPGHLVVYDCTRKSTMEIQQGVGVEDYQREVKIGPDKVRVTDRRTSQIYEGKVSPIKLIQQPLDTSVSAQMKRTRKTRIRFTRVLRVVVEVSEDELVDMRARMALAFACGNYNLFREIRVFDPTAGRCLLPLEVLASHRGVQNLPGSNAAAMLEAFIEAFPGSCSDIRTVSLVDIDAVNELMKV